MEKEKALGSTATAILRFVILILAGAIVLGCDDIALRIAQDKAGPPPHMNVKQGPLDVSPGGTSDFGECAVSSGVDIIYTIENTGDGLLQLTGSPAVRVVNGDASGFVTTQPAVAVQPHTEVSFTVTFAPLTQGAKEASVVIESNDPDPARSLYTFTVTGIGLKPGTVAIPNGDEAYLPGTDLTILWGAFQCTDVKIELMSGGSLHTTIVATTPNDGSHVWSIPPGFQEGADYRIRVTSADALGLADESDSPFAIGTIAVTSPAGGEIWNVGGTYDVTWSSGIGGQVKVELLEGADVCRVIAVSAPNTNLFHWDVPSDLAAAADYRIRVTSLANPSIVDASDGPFSIREWLDYGFASTGEVEDCRIAIGADGKPIIVAADAGLSWKVSITKWSTGTAWTSLGTVGSLTGNRCDIAIDSADGKPVVIFRDFGVASSRFHVMKWSSGTTWSDRGLVSVGGGEYASIAMGTGSKPWVIYQDCATGYDGAAYVKLWNTGTTWDDRGKVSAGATYFNAIAMDPVDGKPVVTFWNASPFQAVVKKYVSDTTWIDLGLSQLVGGNYNAVAVGSDGMPVVAYQEIGGSPSYRCRVQRYTGSGWEDLGYLSAGQADFMNVVIDPADGEPIVVFYDCGSSNRAVIKKHVSGTTWADLGFASTGAAWYTSIAIDPTDGNPVVVFRDDSQSKKAHVIKRFH